MRVESYMCSPSHREAVVLHGEAYVRQVLLQRLDLPVQVHVLVLYVLDAVIDVVQLHAHELSRDLHLQLLSLLNARTGLKV